MRIPKNHPRYLSLKTREQLVRSMKKGLVHETGLIAHGRGEAFDYLIGEQTIPSANIAAQVAAAALLQAAHPVISVNGNVVALCADDCVSLAKAIPAKLEVNLFHRTDTRMAALTRELHNHGAREVFGGKADARILGLEHDRGLCDYDGIFSADVVLVPLEDGDRCHALKSMGKYVIAIDLNPLSRTAKTASLTIVDNVTRALPTIEQWVKNFKGKKAEELKDKMKQWDNTQMLCKVQSFISKRLNSVS